MDGAAYFSPDYRTARERFREGVQRLGIPVDSHVITATGPQGETLAIDVASIGPPRCQCAVILSSGLHGIEGFFGSAVQLAWLSTLNSAAELPKRVKVILVHALNPFGFAWLRRWNENNVDLNRNFLTGRRFLSAPRYRESLEVYERLDPFLNPASPPSPWEPYTLRAVWQILAEGWSARKRMPAEQRPAVFTLGALKDLGVAELQKTLPVGQYEYRNGLFYGGDAAEETTAWLQARLPAWVDGADLTLHVDFHTGLGTWGDYKLMIADLQGTPRARWVAEQFGEDVVVLDDRKGAWPTPLVLRLHIQVKEKDPAVRKRTMNATKDVRQLCRRHDVIEAVEYTDHCIEPLI